MNRQGTEAILASRKLKCYPKALKFSNSIPFISSLNVSDNNLRDFPVGLFLIFVFVFCFCFCFCFESLF